MTTGRSGLFSLLLFGVPEETLLLPRPDLERGYNTIFRGLRLTVRTPPAADLVISKLKRPDPADLADVTFLIKNFQLTRADLDESFGRLPARFKADPVVQDNLHFVIKDLLTAASRIDPRNGGL